MSRTRMVDVGSVNLALREAGHGEPLILHPGLGYASWCWQEVVVRLAGRYRTLSLDPRGTGRSDKPAGPYSIDQMADDVAAVVEAAGAEPAHVVGHSMGGYVSQVLAVRHPEKVRSLVLLSTSPGGPSSQHVPAETTEVWRRAAHLSPEDFARMTFPYSFRPGWPEANESVYEGYLAERLRWPTPPERWQDQYAACKAFLECGIGSDVIGQPTLIIHGAQDRVVPVANAELLEERIPNRVVTVLPGAGHNVMLEEPGVVSERISSFLDSLR